MTERTVVSEKKVQGLRYKVQGEKNKGLTPCT